MQGEDLMCNNVRTTAGNSVLCMVGIFQKSRTCVLTRKGGEGVVKRQGDWMHYLTRRQKSIHDVDIY